MNTKLFSEAMSEVNDKYYEEAANYHCKKHGWVKFTSLAACAAIVLDRKSTRLNSSHRN